MAAIRGRSGSGNPLGDQIFCAAFKVYSGMSARRFATDVREACADGLISDAPAHNSIIRYMEDEELTPILRELVTKSAIPLKAVETDFAIDSTGFTSTQLVGLWRRTKYGAKEERTVHDWLKVHAVCGTKTNVITPAEVTERSGADSPQLPPLFGKTAENFNVKTFEGDGAYSSGKNLELIESKGAVPYIPFNKWAVAVSQNKSAVWTKLFHFYSLHRDEFLAVYHRRSNVESTFSMVKRIFGDSVRSKTRVAQINELFLMLICHNIRCLIHEMHELGVQPSF